MDINDANWIAVILSFVAGYWLRGRHDKRCS